MSISRTWRLVAVLMLAVPMTLASTAQADVNPCVTDFIQLHSDGTSNPVDVSSFGLVFQGDNTWFLTQDITLCDGGAIRVFGNVVLDGQNYTIEDWGNANIAVAVAGSNTVTSDGTTLRNLVIDGFRRSIQVFNASEGLIEDCVLRNASWGAIEIEGASNDNIIRRNTIENTAGGIRGSGPTGNQIYHNNFSYNPVPEASGWTPPWYIDPRFEIGSTLYDGRCAGNYYLDSALAPPLIADPYPLDLPWPDSTYGTGVPEYVALYSDGASVPADVSSFGFEFQVDGTWLLTDDITFCDGGGLRLFEDVVLNGQNHAIRDAGDANQKAINVAGNTAPSDDVIVKNIVIEGFTYGISVYQASATTIEGCVLDGASGGAIQLQGDNGVIRRNTIVNTPRGITGVASTGSQIYYNNFNDDPPLYGWYIDSRLLNNTFDDGICAGNYWAHPNSAPAEDRYPLDQSWPNGYDGDGDGVADCGQNNPPTCAIGSITGLVEDNGSYWATDGVPVTVDYVGADVDLDDLTSSISGEPAGASFSPTSSTGGTLTSTFSFTPSADSSNDDYVLVVTFDDGSDTATCDTITINGTFNQQPTCDAGDDVTIYSSNPAGESITLSGNVSDPDQAVDGEGVLWLPSDLFDDDSSLTPTGMFPIDATLATLTYVDGRGGMCFDDVTVTITFDDTPPAVACSSDVAMLWPPNHRLIDVTLFVEINDASAAPGEILPLLVTVTSDEPDNGLGDGDTTGDVNGQDAFSSPVDITTDFIYDAIANVYYAAASLRSERDGGQDGRSYCIDIIAEDLAGNTSGANCCIHVPHHRRGRNR